MDKQPGGKRTIKLRGRVFTGTVVKAKAAKTAVVSWGRRHLIKKYERFEKRRTKLSVHNELNAKEGDIVEIAECRPLSKTKHFMITKVVGQDRNFIEKVRLKEEGRMRATDREIAHKEEEQHASTES
ncbi:MAG: 30S ribosomal protein S17 [Nanoarchaeota archaeon]